MHNDNQAAIEKTHNTSRYFVEQRQVGWVLLLATVIWGVYGYFSMPQRKDPDIPVREALAAVAWPGMPAEQIEQQITKRIETAIAQNAKVVEIRSVNQTGGAFIYFKIDERVADTGKELDDIKLKLDAVHDLPAGAGPISFVKDFGDTAALMLTLASPKADAADLDLRARDIRPVLDKARSAHPSNQDFSLLVAFPRLMDRGEPLRLANEVRAKFATIAGLTNLEIVTGPGFVGIDGCATRSDAEVMAAFNAILRDRAWRPEFHPDTWQPFLIRDLGGLRRALEQSAGDKYTHREMDQFSEQIEKKIKTLPLVSKVNRTGVMREQIELLYSQRRIASYGLTSEAVQAALQARNTPGAGGTIDVAGRNVTVRASGEFRSETEIGNVLLPGAKQAAYVRDVAEIHRGYELPAQLFHYFNWRDSQGNWNRSRAITLDIQMRAGGQIGTFGESVDESLREIRKLLPGDLVVSRTSDQPQQVKENVDLFMSSLWEAIALVVVVSLIGFWEWRSALIMAISIPITLAMTFGLMQMLGVDLQQVSIASLIIALGLLVDDPVVAGDAIKRELAEGRKPLIAAWWGPTKLAHAILYATITNIVAYLPFLILTGDNGAFIYTLPIVITCSLVASRVVSMTFIPLLGFYLLRAGKAQPDASEVSGFAFYYKKIAGWAIDHRIAVFAASLLLLVAGAFGCMSLKSQFFPQDLQYLAYVDVWLPEDAPLAATQSAAVLAEDVIKATAPKDSLESTTSWVGGGSPRFWFSAAPEPPQLNYAHILLKFKDKHETSSILPKLQAALTAGVPNARIDVRALETGPVAIPVAIRISGDNIDALRKEADRLKAIMKQSSAIARIRDDWGEDTLAIRLQVSPERANLAGFTNQDVAESSLTALQGATLTSVREGDRQLPVVARLRLSERPDAGGLKGLYVHTSNPKRSVPLEQVAAVNYSAQAATIRRFNQYRTITVSAFAAEGKLPSEFLDEYLPQVEEFGKTLPPGMKMEIAGEYKEQNKGFAEQAVVMAVSIAAIFLALVFQFKHAFKPLIVFAAIPFGVVGALLALRVMGTPFGFMGFLGVASLVGVIVSHIIVLFDFIEEAREEGASLRDALIQAGIVRLRPVLITVGATVIALFPLASHGGPLWEPLCYTQIGGLTISTAITLLLVPVVYAIFVLDLKLVKWESAEPVDSASHEAPSSPLAPAE
jgi:multidrug efflux pump subunit AcrB